MEVKQGRLIVADGKEYQLMMGRGNRRRDRESGKNNLK
jgi:hypothetical protein